MSIIFITFVTLTFRTEEILAWMADTLGHALDAAGVILCLV